MADDHNRPNDANPIPPVREAIDAQSHEALKADPTDCDAKLDVALDESFPTSDAPANTLPGRSDPAPSSGYDEAAERALARRRNRNAFRQRVQFPTLAVIAGIAVIAALAVFQPGRIRD